MSSSRVIPLTVTSRYAKSWGAWEGIRELVQNWHDGLHSVVALLDDLPLTINATVDFRQSKSLQEHQFEAFIHNTNTGKDVILGNLVYNILESKLILTNQCTALQKKILLLGYSAKAETKEVIGQFGEGLKIGALALVRQGHLVTMETGNDRWEFQLLDNEEFEEKVLTVVISERLFDLDDDPDTEERTDEESQENSYTCTKVSGLDFQQWKTFLPRFLFLQPPKTCVNTELGTLLLDPELAGQMYMKGIWVSDLSSEDLSAGVDFLQLQLDRDRNAVPKPSEIDHQVSGMWIRALQKNPDLCQQYFYLLIDDKYRDVRHAAAYATPEMTLMIAEEFLREYGENAFPVFNRSQAEDLRAVREELNKTAILCTETLLQLLIQSGRFDSLKTALEQQRMRETEPVPFISLSGEQREILQEAAALVKFVEPSFSLADMDVVKNWKKEACCPRNNRMCVPLWMLDADAVHNEVKLSSSDIFTHGKCKCRESLICLSVLDVKKRLIQQPCLSIDPNSFKLHPVLFIITDLASQVCAKASEAYCAEIHQNRCCGTVDEKLQTELQEREESYLQTIAKLEVQMESLKTDHIQVLQEMNQKVKSAEDQLVQREVDLVNDESVLQQKCEQQINAVRSKAEDTIKKLQERMEKMEKQMTFDVTLLQQRLLAKGELQKQCQLEMDRACNALEKRNSILLQELTHYITQNRNRTKSLSQVSKEGCKHGDAETREKWALISSICDILVEDLQSEKFICAVCKMKRKTHLVQPCGHFVLCESCAEAMFHQGRCPICKNDIDSYIPVYE